MNRREALQSIVGGLTLPAIIGLADCDGKTSPIWQQRKFTVCSWVRHVKEKMDAYPSLTLDVIQHALECVMTREEFNNRMNLVLLPRDLQDRVDAGGMPLAKAIILSHDRAPHEIWDSAHKLFDHQLEILVRWRSKSIGEPGFLGYQAEDRMQRLGKSQVELDTIYYPESTK